MGTNTTDVRLRLDAGRKGERIVRHWSTCVGAGRAREGLDAAWQRQLAMAVQECGFAFLRCHGLFHDDMFVYRERSGCAVYNWQYVDAFIDALLDCGVRPFLELGFCPKDLARDPSAAVFWWKGNPSPPKDMARWSELVAAFARHCIARYGTEEVRRWWFEVWNEPNLTGCFWHGTREEYFDLYRHSARALKSVDRALRVGGPSSCGLVQDDDGNFISNWTKEFLAMCRDERVPVDFVAAHSYPCYSQILGHGTFSPAKRPFETTRTDLEHIRGLMRDAGFAALDLHITEWNVSVSCRDLLHDFPPTAAYILKVTGDVLGMAQSLSWWTFTDIFEELGAGDTVFHGGFGLIHANGVVKPAYHAFRFLNRLGDELLSKTDHGLVTRHADGRIVAVMFHYPEPGNLLPYCHTVEEAESVLNRGATQTFDCVIEGLPPGAEFTLERIGRRAGWAYPAWQAMGAPEPPTREQAAELRRVARGVASETLHADANGRLLVRRRFDPWDCALLEQQP